MDPVEPLMWLGNMLPEVESNNHIKALPKLPSGRKHNSSSPFT